MIKIVDVEISLSGLTGYLYYRVAKKELKSFEVSVSQDDYVIPMIIFENNAGEEFCVIINQIGMELCRFNRNEKPRIGESLFKNSNYEMSEVVHFIRKELL